jgi:hypothetical protein
LRKGEDFPAGKSVRGLSEFPEQPQPVIYDAQERFDAREAAHAARAGDHLPRVHRHLLLLTNALSVIVAAYAVSLALGGNPRDAKAIVVSRANAMLAAMWPGNRG